MLDFLKSKTFREWLAPLSEWIGDLRSWIQEHGELGALGGFAVGIILILLWRLVLWVVFIALVLLGTLWLFSRDEAEL